MSDNIKELARQLRLAREPIRHTAALALEALAGEVERLQSLVVETSAKAGAAIGSCEVLADAMARKDEDVAEVTAERDELANWKASFLHENEQILASNAQLAAERDRLKAALEFIARGTTGSPDAIVARKALGGDAS